MRGKDPNSIITEHAEQPRKGFGFLQGRHHAQNKDIQHRHTQHNNKKQDCQPYNFIC
jgi:hypothetical protein